MNVTRHNGKGKFKKRVTITQCAERLGVTREHLSRVLHGHRVSARLMAWVRKNCPQLLKEAA